MSNDNFRLLASMSDTGYTNNIDYKTRVADAYQSKIDNKFDQSTSIRMIQEEYPYGSGNFRDLICRVVSVRTVGTGSKMSDSYKTLIFKNQENNKGVGYLYKFEDNYWIACNSDVMSSQTDSIVVRRCNNMLRWKDINGNIKSVPISFEEDAFYLTNEIKQDIDRSNGYRKAIIQRTDLTKTIEPNQRFIFGDQCLKISGSGIGKFLNQSTENDASAAIIRLTFEYDFVNPSTDDMINKIANAYSNNFSIEIDQKNIEYAVSLDAYKFTASILNNNINVDQNLTWTIESSKMYTMTQLNNELSVVFDDVGTYVIKVESQDNPLLKTSISINTTNVDKYIIQCSPISEVIYKGDTEVFTFDLYKNGQIVNDCIFDFEKTDNLTSIYYTHTRTDNKIYITNNKMSATKVGITCKSLNYAEALPYSFDIKLGGAW